MQFWLIQVFLAADKMNALFTLFQTELENRQWQFEAIMKRTFFLSRTPIIWYSNSCKRYLFSLSSRFSSFVQVSRALESHEFKICSLENWEDYCGVRKQLFKELNTISRKWILTCYVSNKNLYSPFSLQYKQHAASQFFASSC